MRFLFSVHPAAGHLQPVAPVVRALCRRGHQVRVATSPSFCHEARSLGLDTMPVGLDWSRSDPELAFPELAAIQPTERYDWILRHVYAGKAARQTMAELRVVLGSWRPDVLVRDQMEFGSLLAAELLDIPHVSYGYGQGLLDADRSVAADALAPLRAELGLKPDPDLSSAFRFMRIEFAPPSYLAPGSPRLPNAHHVRAEVLDDRRGHDLPRWVAGLRRPAIVVTLGTNYNRTPGVFETAVEALADDRVDVVLTVGVNRDPAELEPLPSNVRAVRYVPLSLLLPRVDLTVCHAGFNTVMTAVTAGTSLVLIPIDSDQPAQARRCAELGLGRTIDLHELSPERLHREVRTVLDDRRYRRATDAFRAELKSLPSTGHAADLLERLGVDNRPLGPPRVGAGEPAMRSAMRATDSARPLLRREYPAV
jgi:UDP:flavonoid glycosyltransferase YjiC (YdhE family)